MFYITDLSGLPLVTFLGTEVKSLPAVSEPPLCLCKLPSAAVSKRGECSVCVYVCTCDSATVWSSCGPPASGKIEFGLFELVSNKQQPPCLTVGADVEGL